MLIRFEDVLRKYGMRIYGEDRFDCPFCKGNQSHTANFFENPDSGDEMFNCYRCGTSGDIFKFVAKVEDISYGEARRRYDDSAPMNQFQKAHLAKMLRKAPRNMVRRYLNRRNMSYSEKLVLKEDIAEMTDKEKAEFNSIIGYPAFLFPITHVKLHKDGNLVEEVPIDDDIMAVNEEFRRYRRDNIESWEEETRFWNKVAVHFGYDGKARV